MDGLFSYYNNPSHVEVLKADFVAMWQIEGYTAYDVNTVYTVKPNFVEIKIHCFETGSNNYQIVLTFFTEQCKDQFKGLSFYHETECHSVFVGYDYVVGTQSTVAVQRHDHLISFTRKYITSQVRRLKLDSFLADQS